MLSLQIRQYVWYYSTKTALSREIFFVNLKLFEFVFYFCFSLCAVIRKVSIVVNNYGLFVIVKRYSFFMWVWFVQPFLNTMCEVDPLFCKQLYFEWNCHQLITLKPLLNICVGLSMDCTAFFNWTIIWLVQQSLVISFVASNHCYHLSW